MKVITIGRNSDNDIIINDTKVSRHHLQILQNDNGTYQLIDFGSTNGTFVNGTRINGEVSLSIGDIVKIGNIILPWTEYFVSGHVNDENSMPPQYSIHPTPKSSPIKKYLPVIISGSILLAAIIVFAIIWGINANRSQNAKYIPEDAFLVASINLYQLPSPRRKDKEFLESQMSEIITTYMSSNHYNTAKILEKIQKDQNSSGINLRKNIYSFSHIDNNRFCMGIICSVDPTIFKNNIENICHDFNISDLKFNERDGITYCDIEHTIILGWKKETFIMLISDSSTISYNNLKEKFYLKKEHSFVEKSEYSEFNKNGNVLNFYMSSNIIKEIPNSFFQEQLGKLYDYSGINFNDNYVLLHVDIKDGKVELQSTINNKNLIKDIDCKKIINNKDKIEELMSDF